MSTKLTALNAKKFMEVPKREQIVTDRLVDWFSRNTHIPITLEDMPLVQELLLDESNHTRGGRFGASSRGTCERAQVFGYLGTPAEGASIDYQLANIFIDGQWRHVRWQMIMMKAGVMQEPEVKFAVPELRLGTSLDGVHWDDDYLIEIKGDGTYAAVEGLKLGHDLQIGTYFLASEMSKCVYLVEKKGTNQWTEIVVRPDDVPMREVEDELWRLNKAIDRETLPQQLTDCSFKTGTTYRKCPYRDSCSDHDYGSASGKEVTIRRKTPKSRAKKPTA